MATTHNFKDANDFTQGGEWFDDYGQRICEWAWDVDTKELNVKCGINGKKYDLSTFEEQTLTEENLKHKLPSLAIETAEQIKNVKYNL